MDTRLVEMLRDLDPVTLGQRIKSARLAGGLTQGQLAEGRLSVAYLSRIESGQRRADAHLVEQLAQALGLDLEDLLTGSSTGLRDELALELDYAELELQTGSGQAALERLRATEERLRGMTAPDLAWRMQKLLGLALEMVGQTNDAIRVLEDLQLRTKGPLDRAAIAMSLSRCLRVTGETARAISVGEAVMQELEDADLGWTDAAIQLTVTVAGAHHVLGDLDHALRMCQRAAERAEAMESPLAQASAYWNTSIFESDRGNVEAALPLAQRALSLMESVGDARHLARLRATVGNMLLCQDPPAVDEARTVLMAAAEAMAVSSASAADIAASSWALARVEMLAGSLDKASELAAKALAAAEEAGATTLVASVQIVQGEIAARRGDLSSALPRYRQAVYILSAAGADRQTAQLWYDLAHLFEEAGDAAAALDAYKRAGATTGLLPRRTSIAVD
jgi:tetratricopeptide (TPR) repeat protein